LDCASLLIKLRGLLGSVKLARYIVRASGAAGPVEFQQRLTIDQALEKARELRDAHFSHITIFNVLTGVEITDLEALMGTEGAEAPSEGNKSVV
jgi:hypothetical protein